MTFCRDQDVAVHEAAGGRQAFFCYPLAISPHPKPEISLRVASGIHWKPNMEREMLALRSAGHMEQPETEDIFGRRHAWGQNRRLSGCVG